MPIVQFPSPEDRQHIHNLINHYAHGKCGRNDLMRRIAHIIEKYNLDHMPIFGYTVRILQYYKNLPIISIECGEVTDHCPVCKAGTDVARYLRTEKENFDSSYDLVSVTCLECGCVYQSAGYNGRINVAGKGV